jgi:serine/threonine-protein kinase
VTDEALRELRDAYVIQWPLALGGFKRTYLAVDRARGAPCVVKVLHESQHQQIVARFQQEARLLSGVNHPAIPRILDVGRLSDGRPYLVSEFVDGVGLDEKLQRAEGGILSELEACQIVADVAEGLSAVHEAGVIHRDVKPPNIFLEPSGRVRIIDFGNPRKIAADLAGNIVLGTPRYMSPEHCMGKPLLPASDLYSLGVVLVILLTGESPFSGSPKEMMESHVRLAPPRLEDFGRPYPAHLERIVSRLLAKDPAARYPSGRDLANDLHRRAALPLLHTGVAGGMTS